MFTLFRQVRASDAVLLGDQSRAGVDDGRIVAEEDSRIRGEWQGIQHRVTSRTGVNRDGTAAHRWPERGQRQAVNRLEVTTL